VQGALLKVSTAASLNGCRIAAAQLAIILATLVAGWAPILAHAAEVVLTVEVPAGQFKRARMPNLPKDATLAVAVQTSASGKLVVFLINERAYQRPPKPEEPVFIGTVERRLSFTVTIPETGSYFIVLDNRRGQEAQKIKLGIRAEAGRAAQQSPPPVLQPPLQLQPQPPLPDAPSAAPPAPQKHQDKL
jgi:hypothetical protein